jgi:hypothetical protein
LVPFLNSKFKRKVERGERKEETRHSTEPDKARNGISNGIFLSVEMPFIG